VPSQLLSKPALPFFLSQLEEFQQQLEEWLGKQITEADLSQSIEVYNRNRGLLRQLYQFRKETPARISGRLALEAVLAGTLMDKAEHNVLLEEVLASPKEVQEGVRLMVVGSENDDTELIGMLEAMGSVVVIEDHCLGTRLFWDDVTTDDKPLSAIARRYLGKPPCPLLDCGERQRGEYLQKMAREYQVEGIIFLRQKFCDAHAWDQPFLQTMFQEMGLSCLSLELDVTVPTGQYKTRVEAFLEVLDLEGE
jgi:benzoyl-CoA reductase subunit C